MERNPNATDRISGLDSIRFACALWVFFYHGAAPPLPNPFAAGSHVWAAFRALLDNLWVGPAAVIVFFVISGFCIHYPFAGSDRRPALAEFYTRRFVRLLVPVAVAVPLSGWVGVRLASFHQSIIWSLLCELIYYVFYPLLRAGQLRFGSWRGLVAAAFVGSWVVAATYPSAGDYPSYGWQRNWLLGLPCWLLGCSLAESVRTGQPTPISTALVWVWRLAIVGAAGACSVLRFHGPYPLGFPWTLNLFAVLAVLWLQREIAFRQRVAAWALFEWAGLWSYSLYIIHSPAKAWFATLFPSARGSAFGWGFLMLFVFAVCYAFYLLVERPSHVLARRAARKFRPAPATALAPRAV